MQAFLSSLFPPAKGGLAGDLAYISGARDEVDSDELVSCMRRVRSEVEPTYRGHDRQEAMRCVQECIYDTARWRRVYNGLRLLEALLELKTLAEEQRQGRHFDVVQTVPEVGKSLGRL